MTQGKLPQDTPRPLLALPLRGREGGGYPSPRAAYRQDTGHDSLKAISFKSETDAGDDHRLERRLCYNAHIGRPSFERRKEVSREHVLVATHRRCKTIHQFLVNLILSG
jgi:hypothetical protein